MADPIEATFVLLGLLDATALYAAIVIRRMHQRRLEERIRACAHLYGLVRITLADRRAA